MIGNLNIANSNRKDINIKFTKDQEIAVHELIEFLAQPWDDKKFINALCGAGGTGKTFVIKYVINNCKWSGGAIVVLAVPTGCVTAVKVDGNDDDHVGAAVAPPDSNIWPVVP